MVGKEKLMVGHIDVGVAAVLAMHFFISIQPLFIGNRHADDGPYREVGPCRDEATYIKGYTRQQYTKAYPRQQYKENHKENHKENRSERAPVHGLP